MAKLAEKHKAGDLLVQVDPPDRPDILPRSAWVAALHRVFRCRKVPKTSGERQRMAITDRRPKDSAPATYLQDWVDCIKIELRDSVHWIQVTDFSKYECKHSLSEEEPLEMVVLMKVQCLPVVELKLQQKQKQLPINPAKLRDIHKQLNYICAQYVVLSGDASSANDEESGADAAEVKQSHMMLMK